MDGINYGQVKNEWKRISFGEENLDKLYSGIKKLRDVVACTMGAKGKTVILHDKTKGRFDQTKDGVSVAKEVFLQDPIENIGAQLIKQVAQNVVKAAGDGTTTATVFSEALVKQCVKLIKDGVPIYALTDCLNVIHAKLTEHLKTEKRLIKTEKEVINIARIASNNDKEITDLIFKALSETSEDTVINLEYSNTYESNIVHTKGYSIDRGYLNHNFKDPNRLSVEYKNPLIFITTDELIGAYDVEHIMQIAQDANRPLVIIAKDFLQDAYNYITMNKLHRSFPVLPIKAPRFGIEQYNILEDIAVYTNARLINKDSGIAMGMVDENDLGSCENIKAGSDYTHIFGGHHNELLVQERVKGLKLKLVDTEIREKHNHFITSIKERISKLEDGICTIQVGGVTKTERKEKYDRVEDSLRATTSALEHGYIVGGGLFYAKVGSLLQLQYADNPIYRTLINALFAPSDTILDNAWLLGSPVHVEALKILRSAIPELKGSDMSSENRWINAETGELSDLLEEGIIDAAKSTETIIDNAISFAKTLITTDATIVHELEYFQNIQS